MKELINTVKGWIAVAYILTHRVTTTNFIIGDGRLEYYCGPYHICPREKDLWVHGKKEYHRVRNYATARLILQRCFLAKMEFDNLKPNTTTNDEK